jgi:pyruvate dehydrogenase E1 component alpha subunit
MVANGPVESLPYSKAQLKKLLGARGSEIVVSAHRWMILARTLDARMQALQRQGRVGFYGAATGQEAVNVAAGLASQPSDWILPGLREQLVALVRGHPLPTYIHHLFGDAEDPARGRNMPCHPTARDVQYVSMSSVIGTQISHAVGIAYGLRLRRAAATAFAFFGDGATSSNDFAAGLNFAAVFGLPVLFCCANNQWAISVPVEHQSRSATLASKAAAYGMPGSQVDGTDFIATYAALAAARERVVAGRGPEMLEFVTFRMTPHSSSDDPTRYQPTGWAEQARRHDPVERLERWLLAHGLLDEAEKARLLAEADARVRAAIQTAESTPPPPPETLTEDVYAPPGSGGPSGAA